MTKYMNRPHLTKQQELEVFPLIDRAMELPFGKAIVYPCPATRANYLYNVISGERYRNAIESISTYAPDDPLYGKGLYYHVIVDTRPKGLIIAHVQDPPDNVTWEIIRCLATKQPVPITKVITTQSRLNKLQERFIELHALYVDRESSSLMYSIPNPEELLVVDIDLADLKAPTAEQNAKARLAKVNRKT